MPSAGVSWTGSDTPPFLINAVLNGAWVDAAILDQRFLFTVLPDAGVSFLTGFTFDVERPSEDVTALFGEPGHRWVTTQGPRTATRPYST